MLVRIIEAELRNFKNVESGTIKFANFNAVMKNGKLEEADLAGIYGANGSGKTAMVEALSILREILLGGAIPQEPYSGLVSAAGDTVLSFKFYIENNDSKSLASYAVNLLPLPNGTNEGHLPLFKERLTYYTFADGWQNKEELSLTNVFYDMSAILNQDSPTLVKSNPESFADIPLLAQPEKLIIVCAQRGVSIFFNEFLIQHLERLQPQSEAAISLKNIIIALNLFSRLNFQVVKTNQLGAINLKTFLPLFIHERNENTITHGSFLINAKDEHIIEERDYEHLKKAIPALNIALSALIPNLTIALKETDRSIRGDKSFVHASIEAVRDGKHFSIRYESEGIQRIISVLSYLIALYNDPQICLVVDEFDDGIFEYLLGELIGILGREAKGQFIFTSHNLRVLEKLDNKRIFCTTINPKNRYIQLDGAERGNARDFYIRSIVIGGQKEELYNATELDDISAAFRRAYTSKNVMTAAEHAQKLNALKAAILKAEAAHE